MTGANDRLERLTALGTSIWLDQIRRELLTEGEFQRLVDDYHVSGVTANPAIFEQAIDGNDAYDEQIAALARDGKEALDIYRGLAMTDIQGACDVLRPLWERTGHADGFASFEVDPGIAHDSTATTAQAREYWEAIDRPNLMIKIPATEAGLESIADSLAAGINVNITLLFDVGRYEQVMQAFIDGMTRRLDAGESLDVHSVASFFVSRVDTEVDARLGDAHPELHGRAGVANARAAYRAYQRIIGGEPFARLRAAGCPVQRPLWASTGTKNPAYSDILYVDELAGPETVNTMPLKTLEAAADHSTVTEARCALDPTETLDRLAAAGIDMADVTDQLLRDGITKFDRSLDQLLAGIEQKRARVTA